MDDTVARAKTLERKARKARKAAEMTSIFTALSMLLGAFIACVSAAWVAVCETSTRRGILSSLPPRTTGRAEDWGRNADDGVTPDVHHAMCPYCVTVESSTAIYWAGHYSLLSSFSSFSPSSLVSP